MHPEALLRPRGRGEQHRQDFDLGQPRRPLATATCCKAPWLYWGGLAANVGGYRKQPLPDRRGDVGEQ